MERTTRGWMARTMLAGACAALLGACGGGDDAADSADTVGATMGAAPGDTLGMGTPAAAPAGLSDPQIVAQLSAANGLEIAAGELAGAKARSGDVQAFARDMVAEHQAMQGQVDSLVVRAGITPQPAAPDTLAEQAQQARQQLDGQAAGAEFDRMYMDMQVRDHEATLALLNAARSAAQHADLRTIIDGAIPKVTQHLERARQVRGGLGGG